MSKDKKALTAVSTPGLTAASGAGYSLVPQVVDFGTEAGRPKQIRKLRQTLGLSQQAFAAIIGCQQHMVSHWENGKHSPRGAYLKALKELAGEGKERKETNAFAYDEPDNFAGLKFGEDLTKQMKPCPSTFVPGTSEKMADRQKN